MAMAVFGRLVSFDATSARYEFGLDLHDPDRGTVAIPGEDPERWYVEGREGRPYVAAVVVRKAVRLREQQGTWPEWASVFTG